MRPSISTTKSIPSDSIFIDKQQMRSKCMISRNINRAKKTHLFFEKENKRSSTKLNQYKIKT
jgi:hypothetical protein